MVFLSIKYIGSFSAGGKAQAVASVQSPASMIVAGGPNGGSANPFDAIGLQSLYNLSNQTAQ